MHHSGIVRTLSPLDHRGKRREQLPETGAREVLWNRILYRSEDFELRDGAQGDPIVMRNLGAY